jgi:hypothetical protein
MSGDLDLSRYLRNATSQVAISSSLRKQCAKRSVGKEPLVIGQERSIFQYGLQKTGQHEARSE